MSDQITLMQCLAGAQPNGWVTEDDEVAGVVFRRPQAGQLPVVGNLAEFEVLQLIAENDGDRTDFPHISPTFSLNYT